MKAVAEGVGLPAIEATRTPSLPPPGAPIMSLVLQIEGPAPSQAPLATVWTALCAVAESLGVSVPPVLEAETRLSDDVGSALAVLALLRTASAAVPELVLSVSGSALPGLPPLPVMLRAGKACRPRHGAAPSPDAHRDLQLVSCIRTHWSHHSGRLGLDDALPRVDAPPEGLVLQAAGDAVVVHNRTGAPLQDLVVEVLGWTDGQVHSRTATPPRALAPGATARWPLRGSGRGQSTAQAQAKRVLATDSGTSPVAATDAGALVVVPLSTNHDASCSVCVAVEDSQGALLGVQVLPMVPPTAAAPVLVSLPEPKRAARARWAWTQHRTITAEPVPVPAVERPDGLDLPAPSLSPPEAAHEPGPQPAARPAAAAPLPVVAAPPPRPMPDPTGAGSDRYSRAEQEPWATVSALFPLNSLDMDGRDRVRSMLQSQRVATIVAGCNISSSTGWKTTVQTMRRLIAHDDASVRIAAASGIGALAGPAMEHLLVRLVEHDPEQSVRDAAGAALASLRSR